MLVVLSSLLKCHHYLTLFFNAFRVFLDTYFSVSFILDLTNRYHFKWNVRKDLF